MVGVGEGEVLEKRLEGRGGVCGHCGGGGGGEVGEGDVGGVELRGGAGAGRHWGFMDPHSGCGSAGDILRLRSLLLWEVEVTFQKSR